MGFRLSWVSVCSWVVVAGLSSPWAVVARRGSVGFDRLDSMVARLALVVVGLV